MKIKKAKLLIWFQVFLFRNFGKRETLGKENNKIINQKIIVFKIKNHKTKNEKKN